MASIFDKTIKYITVEEVQDSTSKSWLAWLSDEEIEILISKSNDILDNYIWYEIDLTDESDKVIYDFKVSSLFIIEQLYENGDMIRWAVSVGSWAIKSETSWDRQVQYDVWTTVSENNNTLIGIPLEAYNILKNYRKIFFNQVI